MNVRIERFADLAVTVQENRGEKFYCLYDILRQTNQEPCALDKEQTPIKLDCKIIAGYRYDGTNFIQSVFVDEKGLNSLLANR